MSAVHNQAQHHAPHHAPQHKAVYKAVLSGATGGIGRAMALELAAQSSHLVLLGRNAAELAALAEMLSRKFPVLTVSHCAGDLSQMDYQNQVLKHCESLGTGINLLVNNAGANAFGPAEAQSPQTVAQLVQVNLIAPIQLTQLLLPLLKKQVQSTVVQVGSIFGYIGYPGNSVYCGTKFGLRGYSQALRRELANSSVRVKYFAPRATKTAINHGAVDKLNAELKVQRDTPEAVAIQLIPFIQSSKHELKIGFPEKLFVFLNQLFPGVNDKAIRGQLPTIQKYF
ncbi:MAG: SDR family oxidoreductase [Limnobacter sp.]|nr:SDR family oxidoreductase [Limnobacter sp.]